MIDMGEKMIRNEIAYTIFQAPNTKKQWLDRNGFRYCSFLSSADDGDVYTLRFPVMNYGIYITVEAELMLYVKTGEIKINCFDRGSRAIYGHWYFTNRDDFEPIVYRINEAIEKKLDKMHIYKKDKNE